MVEEVHLIPVGFDYQRLLQPLSLDDFDPDRIELFFSESAPGREPEAEYAMSIVERMEENSRDSIGAEVHVSGLKDIYDYKYLFKYGSSLINEEVEQGNEVYINISSMPRTVAFAFATAANSIIAQEPDFRTKIHIYYVSPEEYLIIQAKEILDSQLSLLRQMEVDNYNSEIESQTEKLEEILSRLDKGVTAGVDEFNGKHHVEFIATPGLGVEGVSKEILEVLARHGGHIESISEVSRKHGELKGVDGGESSHIKNTRHHIQQNLVPMGLVKEDKESPGRNNPISLTRIGEMWAIAHTDIDYDSRMGES